MAPAPALKKYYQEHAAPALREKLALKNVHQIPRIEKVVINCSVGKEADRKVAVEDAANDVAGRAARSASGPLCSTRTKEHPGAQP